MDLKENCTYVMHNFKVLKYRFAGFADVVAGQFEPGLLVGMLTYIFAIEFILKVLFFLELNSIP